MLYKNVNANCSEHERKMKWNWIIQYVGTIEKNKHYLLFMFLALASRGGKEIWVSIAIFYGLLLPIVLPSPPNQSHARVSQRVKHCPVTLQCRNQWEKGALVTDDASTTVVVSTSTWPLSVH